MSFPRRWLDGDDELTDDERRALGADLGRPVPAHAKRAVRAALALKLSAASAAAAAPAAVRGATQGGVATKLVGLSLLKSAAVGFGISVLVGLGFSLSEQHQTPRGAGGAVPGKVAATANRPNATAPADSQASSQAQPSLTSVGAPHASALHRPAPRERESAPLSAPAASATESQRVAEARTLLRAGRPSDALTALQSLERDEPRGLLVQEREALFIQALGALGQRDAARKRAAVFATQYPASPHLTAVRRAAE